MKGFPLQPIGKGLVVCSKGVFQRCAETALEKPNFRPILRRVTERCHLQGGHWWPAATATPNSKAHQKRAKNMCVFPQIGFAMWFQDLKIGTPRWHLVILYIIVDPIWCKNPFEAPLFLGRNMLGPGSPSLDHSTDDFDQLSTSVFFGFFFPAHKFSLKTAAS